MKRYAWFALVVIALTALLVPLVSALARDALLIEFVRAARAIDRFVDSVPQDPVWLAFLFIAAVVAIVSVLPRPQRSGSPFELARRPQGQVADLALLIRRAGRRPYFRRRLVQRLSHLGRAVFAYRHGIEMPELGRGAVPAGWDLPHGARSTGMRAQDEAAMDRLHPNASLQQALAQLRSEPLAMPGVDDSAVEGFVRFIEEQLEVDYAPVNRSRH